jgi:hypothetical protein
MAIALQVLLQRLELQQVRLQSLRGYPDLSPRGVPLRRSERL